MSDPFVLFAPTIIEAGEFATFLAHAGGVADPDRSESGRISLGNCHVWVFLSRETLAEIPDQLRKAVAKKLGTPPRSCVVLEVGRSPGSGALAIDFAIAFAERWPAVLCDLDRQILDLAELRHVRCEGKSLDADPTPAN